MTKKTENPSEKKKKVPSHSEKPDTAPADSSPVKEKKRHSLPVRILLSSLKVLLLWIPASLIVLLVVVFIAADLFLSPGRVERLAKENFDALSNAHLSLSVRKFSPYSEILIENISISNPEGYGQGNFFELKKFHLRYGFFSMLVGRVHFDELGIYNPRIYLLQKKGIWNAQVLMKPSPAKPKPAVKPKTESSGELPSEITLPWPMRFFFNFVLDDAYVYVRGDSFKAELGGVSFRIKIDIPPFRKVPLSINAVSLLKDVEIILNKDEKIDLSFQSDAAGVEPPLIMTWKLLYHKNNNGISNFESRMKMGTYQTPVRFKNAHLAPLNLLVLYDLYYDPSRDYLSLNDFGISFKGKRWLKIQGSVAHVTKTQDVDIRMAESTILLSDLYPYYRAVTGDESLRFGGAISLAPLTVKGNPEMMAIHGGISMRDILVRMPALELSLPVFSLNYGLDKKGTNAVITADLFMPDFTYKLDRSPSGENALKLNAVINAAGNFSRFAISNLNLRFYEPRTKEDAVRIRISGDVRTAPALEGSVRIDELYFSKDPLADMVPLSLQKSIDGIPLFHPVTGTLDSSFGMNGGITKASARLSLKVPDYKLNDLTFSADIVQNGPKQRIDLKKISLTSPSFGLALTAGGFVEMKTPPLSDSDLHLRLALEYPKKTNLYGPWNLQGSVILDARMKGDLAKGKAAGSLDINHLSVTNPDPQMMLALEDVNMSFPFEYDFSFKPSGGSKIAVDKSGVIDSMLFKEKDNFTIKSFAMKHPARDVQFVMMKDLKGSLFFKKNTFEIQKLSMTVLDGTAYGKDIFFYLADMNPDHMQFNLGLDITNLDVGRLDDPDPKTKTRDAELSLSAKISGTGVDISKGMKGINGTVNVTKVGKNIANKLFKGLSEEKGKSKLGPIQIVVDRFDPPNKFDYYVDGGLMYVTVKMPWYVPVQNSELRFDRIPVQEYLRKVKEK